VCHPFKFRANVSNRRIYAITIFSYVILVIVYLPAYHWLELKHIYLQNHTVYKLDITERGNSSDFYGWYTMGTLKLDTKGIVYFFVRHVVAFLLMCWWNFKIVGTLKRQDIFRRTSVVNPKISDSLITAPDEKTKLVIAIVNVTVVKQLLFFALTAANWFTTLPTEPRPPGPLIYLGGVYSYTLLFNSSINFLLYCAFGSRLRSEFTKLLSSLISLSKSSESTWNKWERGACE